MIDWTRKALQERIAADIERGESGEVLVIDSALWDVLPWRLDLISAAAKHGVTVVTGKKQEEA